MYMYFLVNASPPNWLDVATSNLQVLWLDKKWYLRGVPSTGLVFHAFIVVC